MPAATAARNGRREDGEALGCSGQSVRGDGGCDDDQVPETRLRASLSAVQLLIAMILGAREQLETAVERVPGSGLPSRVACYARPSRRSLHASIIASSDPPRPCLCAQPDTGRTCELDDSHRLGDIVRGRGEHDNLRPRSAREGTASGGVVCPPRPSAAPMMRGRGLRGARDVGAGQAVGGASGPRALARLLCLRVAILMRAFLGPDIGARRDRHVNSAGRRGSSKRTSSASTRDVAVPSRRRARGADLLARASQGSRGMPTLRD